MIEQILIDLLLGFGIGLSLGLLGGGGSILTVPALVYIVGQTPQAAVTASLMIVGINSLMGAFMHHAPGYAELAGGPSLWRGGDERCLPVGWLVEILAAHDFDAALCPADDCGRSLSDS